MKISRHFTVQELVTPDIIAALGEKRAANLISTYMIKELERMRNRFGPIIVNNGHYINSGLRASTFYTKKHKCGMFKTIDIIRQSYSTHQWGNTADLKFVNATPEEVYNYILLNQQQFPFIVRMENAHKTKTWLHVEFGLYRNEDDIEVFNP